jgi:hypothetical protein
MYGSMTIPISSVVLFCSQSEKEQQKEANVLL